MHNESPKDAPPGLLEALFWPAVLAVTLLVLALVVQWLLSLELNAGFWQLLSIRWVVLALLIQGVCAAIAVLTWKWILELNGATAITLYQAVAMIGLNSIGKYAPGKVVGILARGAWLFKRNRDAGLAVRSTLVEQVAMLHVGAVLVVLAWLMKEALHGAALLLVIIALLSVALASRWGGRLFDWGMQLMRRAEGGPSTVAAFERSYLTAICCMLAIWALTVLVLYLCILSFGYVGELDVWWLTWAVSLAYMGGFAAFFLPAGLGARESVMVFLLSSQIELGVAVYVAILHRLVTLAVDCLLGAAALVHARDSRKRVV